MKYLKLEENKKGYDYIVGDIHGCFDELQSLLSDVNFNSKYDRLFSVGDLIDRGPESEKCLQMLLEPFLYSVQGNHEELFCDIASQNMTKMSIFDYWSSGVGGSWTKSWYENKAPELSFWLNYLNKLPYVINVKGSKPFWIVHAEIWSKEIEINEHNIETIVESADGYQSSVFQWSRFIYYNKVTGNKCNLPGPIYCGHTPLVNPGVNTAGHINLDGGAGKLPNIQLQQPRLFMYCHQTNQTFFKNVLY